MSTMREVFESIDEAMFRGMGGGKSSSDARAKMDKERAAKRSAGHVWKDEPSTEQGGSARLYNKHGDVVGEVRWYDEDRGPKYVASVVTPGVRGNPTSLGKFASLEKAKAAVMKELGL